MAYSFNVILFSHEKEWSTDICYTDKPWKYYAKSNIPIISPTVYDFIHIKCPEQINL
jgi:hypothetical protein